jgi:anti-sigma regulatory factor (Ser/Thr protein kinase)
MPGIAQQPSIMIRDRSSIGEARRISAQMADRARIKEPERGRIPLIVTELATNLLLHAQGGEILMGMLPVETGPGLEIVAVDRGPGMADVQRCMADGYSNAGTTGCGLGAVRRLSTEFDIYSTEPAGTVVLSRVRSFDRKPSGEVHFSAVNVPASGEIECGDAWQLRQIDGELWLTVVDGLGHGPFAAAAAAGAVSVFNEASFETPSGYLEAAHSALRSSRGAAVAVARADLRLHKLQYAGVGNIVGSIIDQTGKSRSLMSHNGIIGVEVRKFQQFEYEWRDGDLLVMHSDGMSARWKLNDYPGLARADPGVIAATLYRDAKRGRDDTTVVVARLNECGSETHA